MANELVLSAVPPQSGQGSSSSHPAQALLRKLVLVAEQSRHTRRNYAKALDDLFAFCASRSVSRALLEWQVGMGVTLPPRPSTPCSWPSASLSATPKGTTTDRIEGGQPDRHPHIRLRESGWTTGCPSPSEGAPSRPRQVDPEREARLCHPGPAGRPRPLAERAGRTRPRDRPAAGGAVGPGRPRD
jgi:hypothetical protein